MNLSKVFSPDYATARRRFRQSVSRIGWQLETHSIGASGPDRDELGIDVACSPAGDSDRAVVISSGVHGVEGFFGSAVQLALLEDWASGKVPPLKCIFLHGMNPFGFAWLRRFDENNVDLNRNFLLPLERYKGAPAGYADLDSLLNPRRPPSRLDPFPLRAIWAIARHGMPALRQSIAGGQYEFPQGLFFGGAGPAAVHRIVSENMPRWLQDIRHVVHLDFHTGLGANGECKLLVDVPLNDIHRGRVIDWFGTNSFEDSHSSGIAYQAKGGLGRWTMSRGFTHDYLYACAEFGTYPPLRILQGLRAENQAHHWGSPEDASTARAKQRLKELFCPASPSWRSRTLRHSLDLVARAAHGLAALNSAPPSPDPAAS